METMNMNELARQITGMEHGKVQVNIAQTKEVLRCALQLLGMEIEFDGQAGVNRVHNTCVKVYRKALAKK